MADVFASLEAIAAFFTQVSEFFAAQQAMLAMLSTNMVLLALFLVILILMTLVLVKIAGHAIGFFFIALFIDWFFILPVITGFLGELPV